VVSAVQGAVSTGETLINAASNTSSGRMQGLAGAAGALVSCPSVRNTLCVEFQPLFFQRSASRGWSLIGLRHFSTLRCACFLHKSCHSRRHCPCPLRTVLLALI
jgi:hypothetical protein